MCKIFMLINFAQIIKYVNIKTGWMMEINSRKYSNLYYKSKVHAKFARRHLGGSGKLFSHDNTWMFRLFHVLGEIWLPQAVNGQKTADFMTILSQEGKGNLLNYFIFTCGSRVLQKQVFPRDL